MEIATQIIDDVKHLTLSGVIHFSSRKTLSHLVETGLEQGCRQFIVDLHEVTFIDSAGLGALIACHSNICKQGGHLKLVRVPEQAQRLLDMTKLADFFDLYESVEAARRHARI